MKIRGTILQIPLWHRLSSLVKRPQERFDLANVHADIFQVITGSEDILTLREFVSSQEERIDKVDRSERAFL